MHSKQPALWAKFADRPILEVIEHLKGSTRLVLGFGLANKIEVFAKVLCAIQHTEDVKAGKGKGNRPWVLMSLRQVLENEWLDDFVDVYITVVHDTTTVFGHL
jgi:hypothetical protein